MIITKVFSDKTHFQNLKKLTISKRNGKELIGFKLISKIERQLNYQTKTSLHLIKDNTKIKDYYNLT